MELSQRTWTVVQFMKDKSVEAVPTSWLDADICYWPPLQGQKLLKAIKSLLPPQSSWERCPVKIYKHGSSNDYVKARNKAKMAEETSDLQSEVEQGVLKKRKIQRSAWISTDESSSHDTLLPSPPSVCRRVNFVSVTTPGGQSPSLLSYQRRAESPTGTSTQREGCAICNDCYNRHETALKELQDQNHLLRALMTEMLNEVRQLAQTKSVEATKKPFFSRFEGLKFPIDTKENLDIFENILQDEGTFEDAVEEVKKIGGTGSYNFVRRCLGTIMADEVALMYSWLGRKGKIPFVEYRLARLVICAAERAAIAGTRKDHEVSVQLWLKRAADRISRQHKHM